MIDNMSDSTIGKKAEKKIQEWLNRPDEGYCFDRIKDQMTGFYGSSNICDFTLYKYPNMYYIESKATYEDRFDYSRITDIQYDGLLAKSKISGVFGYVIVLFVNYKRAFILDIKDIDNEIKEGRKSVNIKKLDTWKIPYREIQTIPNNRKFLLDYDKTINDIF